MMLRFLTAAAALAAGLCMFTAPAQADDSSSEWGSSHLPALVATTSYTAGPNMGAEIRAYRDSGRFVADRTAVAKQARSFLDEWLRTTCAADRSCKPAIVFDMDDTLVSWYALFNATDFTMKASLASAMPDCSTPRINATMNLLNYARQRGVQVVVLTGRTEAERAATEACLAKVGAGDVKLILRSPAQASLTALAYKSAERARLERVGWDIALSMGDQVSDVAGGHADGRFVLPNPMYFVP